MDSLEVSYGHHFVRLSTIRFVTLEFSPETLTWVRTQISKDISKWALQNSEFHSDFISRQDSDETTNDSYYKKKSNHYPDPVWVSLGVFYFCDMGK